jgi:predicted ester cyclase
MNRSGCVTDSLNESPSALARGALEHVCSGAGRAPLSRYYSESFVDHVNDEEHRGHEGIRRSVEGYRSVFDELEIRVEGQVTEGNLVTSRFIVSGKSYGRRVRFSGITISRFEAGLIVEDWSVTDTLGLARQLGVWRTLLVAFRRWRVMRRTPSAEAACAKDCPVRDFFRWRS